MSEDLFGNSVDDTPLASEHRPKRAANDMDLVMKVIGHAVSDEGYVLVGPTNQVHRKVNKTTLKKVVWWEADAVHQLLNSGYLKVGGSRLYHRQGKSISGTSVLVPKATKAALGRWKALRRPSTWNT